MLEREGRIAVLALIAAVSGLPPAVSHAAASAPLGVGVTAVGNCKFHGPPGLLAFGNLDPYSGQDASASATLMFKCTKGAAWSVSDDGGMHELAAGSYRMRHTALDAHIPYRLNYRNSSGTSQGANVQQILTIDGLIRAGTYAGAPVGSYSDTVTITLSP